MNFRAHSATEPAIAAGSPVRRAVRMALLLAAAGAVAAMLPAQAGAAEDEELEELEEVVVTGTSIRRAQAEGALPVQVFRSEDIEQSGMTSVTDFIQQLPVMQGFTSAAGLPELGLVKSRAGSYAAVGQERHATKPSCVTARPGRCFG